MSTYAERRRTHDLELHLKGLILVRALLEQRGASETELHQHSDAIERVRAKLQLLEAA